MRLPRTRMVCHGALLALTALVSSGFAETGAAGKSDPKFDIDVGTIDRYQSEAAAIEGCKPDGVVWADRKTGYFYPKFRSEYGKSAYGVFTCYKGAVAADYWGYGVDTNVGVKKGREFPEFFPCTLCM